MLLGFLDSRGQGVLLVLARGHRLATDSSSFSLRKGDANLQTPSKQRGSTGSGVSRVFEVLEGSEGNSFYGSRSGGTTVCKEDEELRGATVH